MGRAIKDRRDKVVLATKCGMLWDRTFDEEEFRGNVEWNPWFKLEKRSRVLALLSGWSDLTDKNRCTLAQRAIAWTVAQPGVTHALCGARTVSQAEYNAGAGGLELAVEDVTRINNDLATLGKPV